MSLESALWARRRVDDDLLTGAKVIKGPLEGYHHETYVLLLPGGKLPVKFREPREGVLWLDRRCFASEEQLLRSLAGHITPIPDVVAVEGVGLQRFIEGRTLPTRRMAGGRVPHSVFDQIVDLFHETVRIRPEDLWAERRCEHEDRAADGDTDGFLDLLIVFMQEQVYARNLPRFEGLFHELGLTHESFTWLRKRVSGMRTRPFCLLHADLHRKNLILDPQGRLWVIDWELATLGDPLYDLATHLYLMRYPPVQGVRMAQEWCRVVERVRRGSSYGWAEDLPRLLAFKRAQSVFTDVIRTTTSLSRGPEFHWVALPRAAWRLQEVLAAAAEPLGLDTLPTRAQIMRALVRQHLEHGC
ncbi:aminoglycoside phosphotransferase family protein [Streptomyces sp. NPDC049541]|uniref:aminoglycoside phosphotransferase family protein n=1 Tax=Streptomyces sp. NPDC049541 TaxID=3365594 RepID=UPI0037B8A76E